MQGKEISNNKKIKYIINTLYNDIIPFILPFNPFNPLICEMCLQISVEIGRAWQPYHQTVTSDRESMAAILSNGYF